MMLLKIAMDPELVKSAELSTSVLKEKSSEVRSSSLSPAADSAGGLLSSSDGCCDSAAAGLTMSLVPAALVSPLVLLSCDGSCDGSSLLVVDAALLPLHPIVL
jgi:hypothetical protein